MDATMYATIQAAKPCLKVVQTESLEIPTISEMVSMATQTMRKMYLRRFSFHAVDLNLNANIGISQTSNQQNITTNAKRNGALKRGEVRKGSLLEIKAPQKIALAGVGIPMKPVCCRSSILNLARRSAEKAAIRNAV